MSVKIDSSEVFKALRQLKTNVKRVENPALRKAASFAQKKLEQNTPYWDGKKSKGKRGDYMFEHSKDHVVVGPVQNGKIDVGFDEDVAWRMHFIEFGTVNQPPQGTVQKTEAQIENQITEIIANELKRRLGL
ncbi:HK97-gp10 family putative phage morphogenesis protein [Enterococcus avium]|jgi:HK97 gp10 family phage protein|uniref:HK97-gp10 family putative phage morphogenesis protein n=1 Tax=Enterococcus avium TaxID=33945 RepID=UPI0020536749|nr:MAG TPA: type I neck protein [Caudoviricetes sp.]